MKSIGCYPRLRVDTSRVAAVGQAGGVLLTETIRLSGLDQALSAGLARWRKPFAVHDPAKVLSDLALSLALGGDRLADVGVLHAEPGVFGRVASDPTVSRTLATLAGDVDQVLAAIDTARAEARARVWALAGQQAPDHGADSKSPLVVDLDATLVTSHSEKEQAAPTFKRGFGFHPLCAFVDHGAQGTGEPLAILLRAGNAGSNEPARPRLVEPTHPDDTAGALAHPDATITRRQRLRRQLHDQQVNDERSGLATGEVARRRAPSRSTTKDTEPGQSGCDKRSANEARNSSTKRSGASRLGKRPPRSTTCQRTSRR